MAVRTVVLEVVVPEIRATARQLPPAVGAELKTEVPRNNVKTHQRSDPAFLTLQSA